MKKPKVSILAKVARVADNLFRDPVSGAYYGIKTLDGKRKLKAFKVTDRKTADKKLADWIRDLESANTMNPELRFEALLQQFTASRSGKKENTVETEASLAKALRAGFGKNVDKVQLPGMGAKVRGGIKTSHLNLWLANEAKKREWKPNSFNRARLFLRQLFDHAVADGVITEAENPFKPKLIRPRKVGKIKRHIPTLEQFEKILADLRAQKSNPRSELSADFLAFEGLAGVGQAEASSVLRDDIHPIYQGGKLVGGKIDFVRVKTQAAFSIPIYKWLCPLVQRLLEQPTHINGRLFQMLDGKKALTRSCARLTLTHFTQRNLRAMCIKRLYDDGVPVKRIAEWQGHNDGGKLIQTLYTEVFCDTDADAEAADIARVCLAA